MATPENDLGTLQLNTIIESTATPGQYGVVVLDSTGADISGGGGGGGAVTIANGADVAEGNTADAGVVGNTAGTISAKLRGVNTTLTSIDGKITAVNTGAVVVSSSALPTGASTSALQTTGNTSLSSIDGKLVLPATLNQKTMANSLAVVIASDQSAIPISGSITASNASIGLTGAVAPTSGTLIGGSDGTNLVGVKVSATGVVSVDGSATTQPVSGTVTANLGTIAGVSTEATLSTLNGKVTACNTGAVTISAALPAGANAIGTVTAVQSTASNLNGQMVGNVASAASDSGNPVKVAGVYNSSAPTFTNGQRADLQVNSNGSLNSTLSTLLSGENQAASVFSCAILPISGSTYSATINTDFGTVVTLRVKNGAGNLFSLNGHNNNAATRYLQIHNTTTALAGGEVPFIPSFVVPTGSQIILGPTDLAGMQGGLYCSTGITWGWSTTKNTYTAATAGDHMTGCSYV